MSNTFRTRRSIEEYRAYKNKISGELHKAPCALCARPAKQAFTHWKVIVNDFPYDLIAKTHDMIVPIRHVTEKGITAEEWQEYQSIKEGFIQQYDCMIESTNKNKTIPEHFHLHLIVGKKNN